MERHINKAALMGTTSPDVVQVPVPKWTETPVVAPSNHIIDVKGLTQVFNRGTKNEYVLFDDFDFFVSDNPNRGQCVSLMGGSGCGKSKLLRTISGIDECESGDIRIMGKSRKDHGNIPMVFQAYSNYEWMTVFDNIALPLKMHNVPRKEMIEKTFALIKMVGLEGHEHKYAKPGVLSGGQLQRVSIARCLACDSDIMFLDEATGALDIKMKRDVQNIILRILSNPNSNPTIVNVTHSVDEAVYLSDRIVILKANPCMIYKEIDIHYTGEDVTPRGPWVTETREFLEYNKEVSRYLDEVCK